MSALFRITKTLRIFNANMNRYLTVITFFYPKGDEGTYFSDPITKSELKPVSKKRRDKGKRKTRSSRALPVIALTMRPNRWHAISANTGKLIQ